MKIILMTIMIMLVGCASTEKKEQDTKRIVKQCEQKELESCIKAYEIFAGQGQWEAAQGVAGFTCKELKNEVACGYYERIRLARRCRDKNDFKACHQSGINFIKDNDKQGAHYYFQLACAGGNRGSCAQVDRIARDMNRSQRDAAKAAQERNDAQIEIMQGINKLWHNN